MVSPPSAQSEDILTGPRNFIGLLIDLALRLYLGLGGQRSVQGSWEFIMTQYVCEHCSVKTQQDRPVVPWLLGLLGVFNGSPGRAGRAVPNRDK